MQKVILVINEQPNTAAVAPEMQTWLLRRNIQTILVDIIARQLRHADVTASANGEWTDVGLMIVLGGDGTLIRAAHLAAPAGIPILGINTGHLGFLTEIEKSEAFVQLEQFLHGVYTVEERMMLTVQVERGGRKVFQTDALNDAVISKGPQARLVHLGVTIRDTHVSRYRADGVIVATPTGSTAYSLSAGGPIVEPTVDVLLITPICPHTIHSRSMVVSGHEAIDISIIENPGEVGLSVDGSDPFPLMESDTIRVMRAPHFARLVRRNSYRFYDVLRKKLYEGSP